MKKLLALILILIMAICVVGCKDDRENILYKDTDFGDYLDLADYEGIEVDLSSDKFSEYYTKAMFQKLAEMNITPKISEGYVVAGNTVNIDYVGKVNGNVYSGGNVNNLEVTIGQEGSIDIPGFQEALVGQAVGEAFEVTLQIPADYKKAAIAGQSVLFTIKINYIADEHPTAQGYYSKLGYETLKECDRDVITMAVKEYLLDKVVEESKRSDYPNEVVEKIYKIERELLDKAMLAQQGKDFATYLALVGQSEEDYKKGLIENKIKPSMDTQMVVYALADKYDVTVSEKEIKAAAQDIADNSVEDNDTAQSIIDSYGAYYFENLILTEKVKDCLFEDAEYNEASDEFIDQYLND